VRFVLKPDEKMVAGFYTLSQYSVDLVKLPEKIAQKLPKYPEVPATLLGRLAIGEPFRGQKLNFSCSTLFTAAYNRVAKSLWPR
jgi:hypothetical protein